MRRAPLLVLLAVLLTVPAAAQNTDIEALSGLQFSFGNPGARSLAMGGAFLGLADDASAAEANPAGLTILRKTEVSIEARNSKTTQTLNVAGEFPDVTDDDFFTYSRRVPVTFASVVTPIGENFSLAAYFHSPIEFESAIVNAFSQSGFVEPILFSLGPDGPVTSQQCFAIEECIQFNLFPFATGVNIRLQTYGVAGAWKMGNLSLGVAGRFQRFEESAATIRTDFDLQIREFVAQRSDDDDVTFSAGFKYAFTDNFSIGGVYKQGAEFETGLFFQDFVEGTPEEQIGAPTFHIPDTYGLGLSFRPIPVLTINADAIRVNHSNSTDNFVTVFSGLTEEDVRGYRAKDVTEIHVGAEYFFTTRIPFAVRVGWWRDPAHGITYTSPLVGLNAGVERAAAGVSSAILYPGSEDQDHITGGFGLAWPNFQIDVAYDTSDTYKVGSMSAVFRF
ncbi:MAG TPA: hypothetical protein VMS12_00010 [Thermoanaerobaculia bacterium]|nr:hypothetical protein [Thermoanaerobaculia bacterium]